ncbi:TPA: helix-turn-helix transcriptional regulator [Stenotrophomonas maltophilia]|nr:helix-turn-helix transcriptional regulator [Stenotrophomonas maltophilia]
MSIGARLEELRKAAQLTQQQVADVVGTTKQYVGRLEKSQNQNPNGVFLTGWARYFGVSPRWLSTGEGPRQGAAEASQSARPDFAKIGHAVVVLSHYLELTGNPVDWMSDPVMLEAAYEVVEEFGGDKPQDNVLDMTKILARKIRGASDGKQDQIRGNRTAAGGKG